MAPVSPDTSSRLYCFNHQPLRLFDLFHLISCEPKWSFDFRAECRTMSALKEKQTGKLAELALARSILVVSLHVSHSSVRHRRQIPVGKKSLLFYISVFPPLNWWTWSVHVSLHAVSGPPINSAWHKYQLSYWLILFKSINCWQIHQRSLYCLVHNDLINDELNAFLLKLFPSLRISYGHSRYFSVLLDCLFCDIYSISKSKL